MKSALNLFQTKKESFVLVNALSYNFMIVIIPDDYKGFTITSNHGHTLSQILNGQVVKLMSD